MNQESKYWYLQKFNMMKKLSKPELMRIADQLEMKEILKNSEVKFEGSGGGKVFFIKKGAVKISRYLDNGEEDVKCILGRGHIFGESGLFGNQNEGELAIALEDSLVCIASAEDMQDIIQRNPSLKISLYKLMGVKIRKLERRLESILYKDARTRIQELLEDLKQDFGKEENGHIIVRNFLTHADIAKLTAISRQTVSSMLNELRDEGAIDYDKDKFVFSLEETPT